MLLNAHNLKCNVNLLTPDQIIFCLADTKNHKFKDSPLLVYNLKKSFRIRTKIKTKKKSMLNFCWAVYIHVGNNYKRTCNIIYKRNTLYLLFFIYCDPYLANARFILLLAPIVYMYSLLVWAHLL